MIDEVKKDQLNSGVTVEGCTSANPLVVKTIRLRYDKFKEWSQEDDVSNIKVLNRRYE